MEEEKKNNKGLMVGIIIFLIICLVAIFYFMFKMTYVGSSKSSNEEKKEETADTAETTQGEFTELTKYELQEGEEKEITVDGKKIKLSKKENKSYINDKEIAHVGFYVTNHFIISYGMAQFGEIYNIYDFEGNIIYNRSEEENETQFENLRIYNNKLLVDSATIINGDEFIDNFKIGKLKYINCNNMTSKDINDYKDILKEHENDQLKYDLVYEIKYLNNKITIEKVDQIKTIGEWVATFQKFCVIE